MILEEENERVRKFDGVLAPDRGSEGDIETGENAEGAVTISLVLWLLGIGIKISSIGASDGVTRSVGVNCDRADRRKPEQSYKQKK